MAGYTTFENPLTQININTVIFVNAITLYALVICILYPQLRIEQQIKKHSVSTTY